GDLTIVRELETNANVFLNVTGKTTQLSNGPLQNGSIHAVGLALSGGEYELTNETNTVGVIASDAEDKVAFVNHGNLEVGTVGSVVGVNNGSDVSIATSGDLLIGEQLKTVKNVFLDVAGKTTQDME